MKVKRYSVLHNDKAVFEQVVLKVAEETGVEPGIIEKDYYVTLFLKRLTRIQPDIIFKGGTSLSKCYKVIKRFSEDIDLSVDAHIRPTEGKRKELKENIVSVIDEFGFTLDNALDIKSRRNYNRYVVDYPAVFSLDFLKDHLVIETAVYIKSYHCERMMATSLIYDYLKRTGLEALAIGYGLEPFELNVQSASRTLIDKLCALGDYYLCGKVSGHSRHIYDICKLSEIVPLNSGLMRLASDVFEARKPHEQCHAAKDGVDLNLVLQEIVDKDIYKKDYEDITLKMLFEEVSYSEAIGELQRIIDYRLF